MTRELHIQKEQGLRTEIQDLHSKVNLRPLVTIFQVANSLFKTNLHPFMFCHVFCKYLPTISTFSSL